MTDYFERATVNTLIPAHLVTTLERNLLAGFGFSCEESHDGRLYFFVDDNLNHEETTLQIESEELAADNSPLAARVRAFLKRNNLGPDAETGVIEVVLPSGSFSWQGVFQGTLRKPGNRGKKALAEIVVMAAYTASRMIPESFGGWVMRITRGRIQHAGTHEILERMRKGRRATGAF